MFPYSYPEYPFLVDPMKFTKSNTLDTGLYVELIRLRETQRMKHGATLLKQATRDLETMSLHMRIITTRGHGRIGHDAYRWSIGLLMLVHCYNSKWVDGEPKAPVPEWKGQYPDLMPWLPKALVWLDKVIAAMQNAADGIGTTLDLTLSLHFCVAWHVQCSAAEDERHGRKGLAAG